MKKNYVLDTNVLIHDPHAVLKFEDNDVILPIYVIEEIDQFKRDANERGRNARTVSRLLDAQRAKGPLSKGVELPDGGSLRVHVPQRRLELKIALNPNTGDHAILQTALEFRDESPDKPTIFVTMDVNLRIRADALGLTTQTYENSAVDLDRVETGIIELAVTAAELDKFFESSALKPVDADKINPNACVVLRDDSARPRTALGRFHNEPREVRALKTPREGLLGIRPRNKEQAFALDLLLDDNVKLITLVGKAGTGKTLLALAAGLRRVVDDGAYARLLVSRPVMPLGRDIGFLPGDVDEKLSPWMQPIFDNLEFLFSTSTRKGPRAYAELLESGQIQVEPLTYIRGRSLPQQFIIVDEAQNLTPHEVKTIITRSGDGTKIVLTGDPGQIDNPYVDSASNGLSVAADRFRGEKVAAH